MSPKQWPFQKLVFISPTVPALDLAEGLAEPAAAPKGERCWLCLGSGEMLDCCSEPITCDCCAGTGTIGGGV